MGRANFVLIRADYTAKEDYESHDRQMKIQTITKDHSTTLGHSH